MFLCLHASFAYETLKELLLPVHSLCFLTLECALAVTYRLHLRIKIKLTLKVLRVFRHSYRKQRDAYHQNS